MRGKKRIDRNYFEGKTRYMEETAYLCRVKNVSDLRPFALEML